LAGFGPSLASVEPHPWRRLKKNAALPSAASGAVPARLRLMIALFP